MMRTRLAVALWLAGGLGWLGGSTLHANPLKDPRRMIGQQSVDLAPLFRWWTNRHGARPLTAWAHVTGSVVGTNRWGWTVEARLDTPPRARDKAPDHEGPGPNGQVRIALKHPPVWEIEEFTRLTAQLKTMNDQSQVLSTEISAAAARSRELRAYRSRSRLLAAEARQLSASENQAKAQLATLKRQIADGEARLAFYPSPTHYSVDGLALDTGEELNGLPAYDYGVPVRRGPPPPPAPSRKPARGARHQ